MVDTPSLVDLHVVKAGNGAGTITSSPSGISCGATCDGAFAQNAMVTLTAAPAEGSTFTGWSGACTGEATTCDVTLAQTKTVTATFTLVKHTVTVTKAGPGMGMVMGPGMTCDSTCTFDVDHGSTISLTPSPQGLSVFAGWGGACSGMASCDLTVTADVTATANFALDNFSLFIVPSGNGAGTVTSNPTGINCGSDCDQTFTANETVVLTATPSTGSSFGGWSGGGCSGTGTCTVSITGAKTVTAMFTLNQYALTVTPAGNGQGTVTGTGIDCGTDCTESYDYNTPVTLTAAAAVGSTFTGWSGACTGTGDCNVTITQAKDVTATFTLTTHQLTVATVGNGAVAGMGINCGTDCTELYNYNSMITLTATPATGWSFTGWSGACSGTGPCMVTMTTARSVTATFTINSYLLTITPPTNGTITGTGISCGSDCSESYDYNTPVALTATPSTGYSFGGWTGACTGTGPCNVTMTAAKTVGATFTINKYLLTITPPTNGTITATGINCGSDCSESYDYNTPVALTATPSTGYSFSGWTGACTGTGPCTVTMTAAKTVGATFTINKYLLTITPPSNGTITGTGINCGSDCSESFDYNTPVALTATPSTGYSFSGWTGACTGTGPCTVTMTAAKTVGATFTINSYLLTVNNAGGGTVAGTGITCGNDCTESFTHGQNVTLTAMPATGYSFTGWSGACSGTGACVVAMTSAQSVTATFTINSYALTVSKTGNGTITGGGLSCGTNCSGSYTYGSNVVLTAAASTGYTFTGWSSTTGVSCPGTGTCSVPMTQAQSVTATFTINSYLLTVTAPSNGTVTGTGITCGNDCSETFTHGQNVVLTATPSTGYSFTGWSSATGVSCPGTGTCTVPMTKAQTVTATFTINSYLLTVTPSSGGTVAGTGITCGNDCTESFTHGSLVTLTAMPATGYTFTGWSSTTGASCPGTGTCTVSMIQAQTITPSYSLNSYALTVTPPSNGSVSGTGITCGNDCSETFTHGQNVVLTATPATGYAFTGWSSSTGVSCPGTGTCTVPMTQAQTVTASFTIKSYVLTVTPPSNGSVAGTGITCGNDCSESFTHGQNVTLTAMPATGYSFTGWSSSTGVSCPGTGTCSVPMTQAQTVTATFTVNSYVLTVTPPSNGTVTGTNINCGADCSDTFTHGQNVVLTATPATGYAFTGWSSSTGVVCAGTGTCSVPMTQAQTVTATFTIKSYLLTVTTPSNGSVSGTGITCGNDCTETFTHGQNVVLTATPNTNFIFTGWSSSTGVVCAGTGTCTVPMTQAQTVTASFAAEAHKVVVSISGGGKGAVEGTGISCPGDCTESGNVGAQFLLVAKPELVDNATRSIFTGWSGACTGTGDCFITIGHTNADVTANFELAPNLMFVTKDIYSGQLDGLAGADKKCQTAAGQAGLPGTYVAYLSYDDGNAKVGAPLRVGGARGWTRTDSKYFARKIDEFHLGQAMSTPEINEYRESIANTATPLVWTGTTAQGIYSSQCVDQATPTVPWSGAAGVAMRGNSLTTSSQAVESSATRCVAGAHLYCFGIDRAADLP